MAREKKMKMWLLSAPGLVHQIVRASSARRAVIMRFRNSKSPKIQKIYRDSEEKKHVHIGYVLGQGRGHESLWVTVQRIIPLE